MDGTAIAQQFNQGLRTGLAYGPMVAERKSQRGLATAIAGDLGTTTVEAGGQDYEIPDWKSGNMALAEAVARGDLSLDEAARIETRQNARRQRVVKDAVNRAIVFDSQGDPQAAARALNEAALNMPYETNALVVPDVDQRTGKPMYAFLPTSADPDGTVPRGEARTMGMIAEVAGTLLSQPWESQFGPDYSSAKIREQINLLERKQDTEASRQGLYGAQEQQHRARTPALVAGDEAQAAQRQAGAYKNMQQGMLYGEQGQTERALRDPRVASEEAQAAERLAGAGSEAARADSYAAAAAKTRATTRPEVERLQAQTDAFSSLAEQRRQAANRYREEATTERMGRDATISEKRASATKEQALADKARAEEEKLRKLMSVEAQKAIAERDSALTKAKRDKGELDKLLRTMPLELERTKFELDQLKKEAALKAETRGTQYNKDLYERYADQWSMRREIYNSEYTGWKVDQAQEFMQSNPAPDPNDPLFFGNNRLVQVGSTGEWYLENLDVPASSQKRWKKYTMQPWLEGHLSVQKGYGQ